MKNTLKNNHHYNTKWALKERLGTRCKQRSPKIYLFFLLKINFFGMFWIVLMR
jgi:hypothetical protein